MEHEMHENLQLLDVQLDQLDPSPAEMLLLFNHMIGWLASTVDTPTWLHGLARASDALTESRAARP